MRLILLLVSQLAPNRLQGRLVRVGVAGGAGDRRPRAWCCRCSWASMTMTSTSLRVIQRVAKRQGAAARTDVPGIIFLEIDGLALPVLRARDARRQRAEMAALARRRHATGWSSGRPTCPRRREPARPGSCSAQTRTSRRFAGSRRRPGRLMACSAPADCAEIERRHASGDGLLIDGGASRGNLLSGEADEVILTVSRMRPRSGRTPATARSSPTGST